MEDKQLNINQPLPSVRRFSSILVSQENENRKTASYLPTRSSIEYHKAELKLDTLSNTGSVPFVWEHSPGRPKDETNKRSQTKESPPSLPKLPPGRILKRKNKDLDNTTENASVIQVPVNRSIPQIVLPTEEKIKFESAKSSKKGSSDSGGDDDSDEAYMDALDTLSRGESSFYNCSASGLGSDVKPPGTLPADRKLRDFMMDRFLPVAKAMSSEVPQFSSRKHVIKEKSPNMDDKKLQELRYGPTFLQDVAQDNEDEEEAGSEYGYDEHGNKSSKLCGLIPCFCTKGSLGLLNPFPGMRTRSPISPANRTQASSCSISYISETENEPARIAIYEHRPVDRPHLAKHQEDNNVLKSESVETTTQNNCPKLEGARLYNRLQGYGISSGPNEMFKSIISERSNSHSRKKGLTTFKDLLADINKSESDGQDSTTEKTLYVDTVHVVKSPKENSLPSSVEGQSSYGTDTRKITPVSCDSVESDMLSDEPKHDKKTKLHTLSWKDPAVDDADSTDAAPNMKASKDGVKEALAPPPLPKSPSDSWLQRTLPSVSSKNTPTQWNPKCPSTNASPTESESDKNNQLRGSQGSLFPIPET